MADAVAKGIILPASLQIWCLCKTVAVRFQPAYDCPRHGIMTPAASRSSITDT